MNREILEFVNKQVLIATHPQINWKTVSTKSIRYLGQMSTLSKILNALFSNKIEISIKMIYNGLQITTNLEKEKISFCWHFLKTSKQNIYFNQECHFQDQSEETQLSVTKILRYKNENFIE